jgi:1,4-dihydroxy-2-naphthoyl-CoA hydrolase
MASVDAAGVLFFPTLFRHAHDAYEAFMTDQGIALHETLADGRYAVPIVHAEADFHRPLSHGTDVTIMLEVARLGESSFTVAYRFIDPAGESCATARTVHVVIERAGGMRRPVPESWRERLAAHSAPID